MPHLFDELQLRDVVLRNRISVSPMCEALELAPIRVNTFSPGPIDTPLLGRLLGDNRDAYVAQLEETLPLRRLGTADEAGAVAPSPPISRAAEK